MKPLFAIILTLSAFFAGCTKEEDILPEQQKKLLSYLTSTHSPKLIAESEVGAEGERPYYSTSGNSAYRYIEGVWNPDRENRTEVVQGSTVVITYRAYVFTFASITDDTMPYDSNDAELAARLYASGLTPGGWKFEPLTIKLGQTEILKGVGTALVGCREGDVVEVYMTYSMAYGGINVSIVPRESPIAFFFTVDKVE